MFYQYLKRTVDIFGAVIGIILMAPFYPFIALAIKIESNGPALITLDRVSCGRVIGVYKFRSMKHGAHIEKEKLRHLNERINGPFFKIKKDPRVTKVGRFLRSHRIDELPQIINVLKGELSLVGPRPHEPSEVIHYPPEFRHIILVKSGVTGLSQVSGASGLKFLEEINLDRAYLKKKSFWFDLKILFKTLYIFLFDATGV
ncbi:multidrug MFS transporter [Candidatus Nomurabacteria bacterium CG10_big_fil_rev_8_21_14_0_10_35_16]|uniref:Multidrug MFS transporter n=1 Tax=Candidatus Nomurabacteria bacterium CG10_big_fil_rev_8_21_14_0_10_35_16 TaxID=1974731 RepID=A0A2H0TBP1_9BACT|nr:MAG: multidrug MFS transporter [Candidatus Nomurabacteria bacterium CG10_big_fil_rev_8_21_14_0_10_35_16]